MDSQPSASNTSLIQGRDEIPATVPHPALHDNGHDASSRFSSVDSGDGRAATRPLPAQGHSKDDRLRALRRELAACAERQVRRHGRNRNRDHQQSFGIGSCRTGARTGRAGAAQHLSRGLRQRARRPHSHRAGVRGRRPTGRCARSSDRVHSPQNSVRLQRIPPRRGFLAR